MPPGVTPSTLGGVRIDRGKIAFAVLALLLAALFVRLGFWQLDRHGQRREANEARSERMSRPVLELRSAGRVAALPPADSLAWRRVRLRGRWDFENEILLRPRSHGGRPAVELLTPLVLTDSAAVLVLRGWLPAPDALHAPLRRARPPGDSATVEGLAMAPPEADDPSAARASGRGPTPVVVDGEEHVALRGVDLESASEAIPYPIAHFYVLSTRNDTTGSELRALPEPALGAGPHFWYAVQWFAFALIAVGGTLAFLWSR